MPNTNTYCLSVYLSTVYTAHLSVAFSHLSFMITMEWSRPFWCHMFAIGCLWQEMTILNSKPTSASVSVKNYDWNHASVKLTGYTYRGWLLLCCATFGKCVAGKPEMVKTVTSVTCERCLRHARCNDAKLVVWYETGRTCLRPSLNYFGRQGTSLQNATLPRFFTYLWLL